MGLPSSYNYLNYIINIATHYGLVIYSGIKHLYNIQHMAVQFSYNGHSVEIMVFYSLPWVGFYCETICFYTTDIQVFPSWMSRPCFSLSRLYISKLDFIAASKIRTSADLVPKSSLLIRVGFKIEIFRNISSCHCVSAAITS